MKNNILLIYGGQSGEHDVSRVSAAFVEQSLIEAGFTVFPLLVDRQGNWYRQSPGSETQERTTLAMADFPVLNTATESFIPEFAFPLIHGTTGEDGLLQGLLESLRLPYAGTGVAGSALGMDKILSKIQFEKAGLPQLPWVAVHSSESFDAIAAKTKSLSFPLFVKPANMGSSVGISKVARIQDLTKSLEAAFLWDEFVVIEQGATVREIEFSILGNYPHYEVSVPGEIVVSADFYSYDAKYKDATATQPEIPAHISDTMLQTMQSLAKRAFAAIRGDGFARVDFFLDKEKEQIYINEINTLPGFTPISMFPQLWKASGLSAPELMRKIVEFGLQRHERRNLQKNGQFHA